MLILASKSPRRQEILRQMGVTQFKIVTPEVDETYNPALQGAQIVEYLSLIKAQATQPLVSLEDIIITADTMVFCDNQPLGKPKDEADALRMLQLLSGREHQVSTGVTVCQGSRYLTKSVTTCVTFRSCSREELLAYIQTGEPMDKAGAYGIQGKGAMLIEGIQGDYWNVVGLPIACLAQLLKEFGMPLL